MNCFTIILTMGIIVQLSGQPYGHTTYTHSANSFLQWGLMTHNVPGFAMIGSQSSPPPSSFNFCIDKVDVDGAFNNIGTTDFYNEYSIFIDGLSNCGPNLQQYAGNIGMTLIEPSGITAGTYAVEGAMSAGLMFATLDVQGSPTAGKTFYYPFPPGASGDVKAHIIQETGTPAGINNFYITGCFWQPT